MAGLARSESDTEALLRTSEQQDEAPESLDATGMNYFMAVVMTIVTAAPFYFVVNELGKLKGDQFIPCTETPCNYIRFFPDASLPGTGYSPMRVQNGVSRPIALTSIYSDSILSFLSLDARTAVHTPTWSNSTDWKELTDMKSDLMTNFFSEHNETRLAIEHEQEELQQTSWILKLAHGLCRVPQGIYMYPIVAVGSRANNNTIPLPMGLIPSAVPAGEVARCESMEVKAKILNNMKSAKSKTVYIACLAGWVFLKIVHDLMLLSKTFAEYDSLRVGALSLIFQLIAASAGFAWSASIAGVFVSPLTADGDVVCFYRYPTISAVLALSTPLLFMYGAFQKVLGVIRSMNHGDYLYYQQFDVPFKYVSQSRNWFKGTLVSSVVCGTKAVPDKPSSDLPQRKLWATALLAFHILLITVVIVPFACPVLLAILQAASMKLLEPDSGAVGRMTAWAVLSVPSGYFMFVLCRGFNETYKRQMSHGRHLGGVGQEILFHVLFWFPAIVCFAPFPSLSLTKAEMLCAGSFLFALSIFGLASGAKDMFEEVSKG